VSVWVRAGVLKRFMWQQWTPKVSVQYGW